jgi:hypothetical protein
MRPQWAKIIGLAIILGLASCASSARLSEPAAWSAFTQSALDAQCDPYFTRPFRGAETVSVAVLGRPTNIDFATRSELERYGTYVFEVETVLFGSIERGAVELSFHAEEDGLGHVYGNDVPLGRTIAYLRQSPGGDFDVVRTFSC